MAHKTRQAIVVCIGLFLSASFLFGQGEELAKLLTQCSPGVINLVVYGKEKQEIAKGSAVVLTEQIAATSYHLVSQAASCVAFNYRKKEVDVEGIIAVDKNLDLALIRIDGKVQIMPLATPDDSAENKKVFAVGANEAGEIIIADGALRKSFETAADQKVWDSSLAVPDTFSGGAVVDAGGKVVGMMIIMDKRLRFIVPAKAIAALPKTAKMTPFKSWQPEDYLGGQEAAWLAGRLYAWMGDAFNAQKNLEKYAKANPNSLEAWTILATVYNNQRDYQNAVTAYKKVIELDPKKAAAYASLGQIYVRMQRPAEAAPMLEKAIELDPTDKEATLALGDSYKDARDFVKAAEAYEKYLSLKPDNPGPAYQRLGESRMQANQFDAAITAFLEALKPDPRSLNINLNLAQSYEKAGQLDKAEQTYNFMAEVDPKSAGSYYGYVLNMYDKAGQPIKAIEAANKLVELNPKSEQAIYNLGYEFQKAQKYQEAIDVFKRVLAINPNYDYAHLQIGFCYYSLKKYKEAIEPFKKNVELVPDNAMGWFYIGICHMYLKDFNAALEPIKKTTELQPDNGNAFYNLAIVYLNLKDNFSAREVYRKLTAIDANLAAKLKPLLR
jgi:tetratricopeptide (TPR) repeat protein